MNDWCSVVVIEHMTILRDPDIFESRAKGFTYADLNLVAKSIAILSKNLPLFLGKLLKIIQICSKPFSMYSKSDLIKYEPDTRYLFSQIGNLLDVDNDSIRIAALTSVSCHLRRRNNQFSIDAIARSDFFSKLCSVILHPSFTNLKSEIIDLLQLFAEKCSDVCSGALKDLDFSCLCQNLPIDSVLNLNEALSIILSNYSVDQLKNIRLCDGTILDYLLVKLPAYLDEQNSLSPRRKALHLEAALVNASALILHSLSNADHSLLDESNTKLLLVSVGKIVHDKRRNHENFEIISAFLILLRGFPNTESMEMLLELTTEEYLPIHIRMHSINCFSDILTSKAAYLITPKVLELLKKYLKYALAHCDFPENTMRLCLTATLSENCEIISSIIETGMVEGTVDILSQAVEQSDSFPSLFAFQAVLFLSQICAQNKECCRRFGPNGSKVLLTILVQLKSCLIGQESHLGNNKIDFNQPIKNEHLSFHRLLACTVAAIRSCVMTCEENLSAFLNLGGFNALLSLLEWLTPQLCCLILRCIYEIVEIEGKKSKDVLYSWRGTRLLPSLGIEESILSRTEEKSPVTLEEQLATLLNEYRIGGRELPEVNLAAFLCHLWRWNTDGATSASNLLTWKQSTLNEDLFLVTYVLLKNLDFGRNYELDFEDQITMLDIENFIKSKEVETLERIKTDLKRCRVNPTTSDANLLSRGEEIAQSTRNNLLERKRAIVASANERNSYLENECYSLPKKIMRQRQLALRRTEEAKKRTSNHVYLKGVLSDKLKKIEESRPRRNGADSEFNGSSNADRCTERTSTVNPSGSSTQSWSSSSTKLSGLN